MLAVYKRWIDMGRITLADVPERWRVQLEPSTEGPELVEE